MSAGIDATLRVFRSQIISTRAWLGETEGLWLGANPTSTVRVNLRAEQLAALYEAAFLRMFTAWEDYLEQVTLKLMTRQATVAYRPMAPSGQRLYSNLSLAKTALLDGRSYLLWHNPTNVQRNTARVLHSCPVETVVHRHANWLGNVAAIRHAIAHNSNDVRSQFQTASMAVTGHVFPSPGKLLRAHDNRDPLNPPRWIHVLSTELLVLANEIAA